MDNYTWEQKFADLFEKCLERYRSGDRDFHGYYGEDDLAFLKSIGYKPREFFDFVEDHGDEGDPTPHTALLIASVRRDFLKSVQNGKHSSQELKEEELPPRDAELGGHAWLPRIIAKARAKLKGELHPDIMYGCGGDRAFLRKRDIHPADFLRAVWAAKERDEEVLDYVRANAGQ